jgi:hypothetical protein
MPRRPAATVAEVLKEEASWSQIREWSKARDDMEANIARVLRAKLDRLREKLWLEECEREMGWSRAQAYRHLNPAQMEKNRQDAATARANVSTVETLPVPAIPPAPVAPPEWDDEDEPEPVVDPADEIAATAAGIVPWAPPEDISAATTFVGMVSRFEQFTADLQPESPVRGLLRAQLLIQQRALKALIAWLTEALEKLNRRLNNEKA